MDINWLQLFSEVKRALKKRGSSEQDADDFVQEAFVRLTCFARGSPVENPEAFLMRTALNLSIDAHRHRGMRGAEVLVDDVVIADARPGVEDQLLARERIARLNAGFANLDERAREMVLSHRLDGMSYEEIARRHGVSISTVHHQIAKALMQLTGWMHGWYP